ncbi:MAG: glycosyltransferase [Planctomycetes bacterium]|nr:glycosyltransferase [Planctomycetota bacterium]
MKSKLVFLMPSLGGGGAERVASILIPYFHKAFDLTLILIENDRAYEIPDNIKVETLSGKISGLGHLLRAPLHLLKLRGLLKKIKPHAVLSFMEEANILNCILAGKHGRKTILSQRVDPDRQYAGKGILGKAIVFASRRLYPRAEHIITVSEGIRKTLEAGYGINSGKITAIGNPIPYDTIIQAQSKTSANCESDFILHVGRLKLPQKGLDVLLEAFTKVHHQNHKLKLILAGDGPDREQLQSMARSLDIDTNVVFSGWQENVPAWLSKAKLFVLASRWEGWPNAMNEALACGCPVIATDCQSGPREILDNGKYGTLVAVDDAEEMAKAIIDQLANPVSDEERERLRNRAREFDAKIIAGKYIDVIKAVMAGD